MGNLSSIPDPSSLVSASLSPQEGKYCCPLPESLYLCVYHGPLSSLLKTMDALLRIMFESR